MDSSKAEIEKILSASLERVSNWLKYAEAKNAALLTFSSLWTIALVNFVADPDHNECDVTAALAGLFLFVPSVALCLYSFLPKIDLSEFFKPKAPEPPLNLLFYGDLAKLDPRVTSATLMERFGRPSEWGVSQGFIDDAAVQIAVNSRIAVRKFKIFQWAAHIALLGLFVIVCTRLVLLVAG